jgi:hypothetical protein
VPICKGQCTWERDLLPDGCHPLKYTIDRYLKDYRDYILAEQDVGVAPTPVPFMLLVAPRNLDIWCATPNAGDGLSAATFV